MAEATEASALIADEESGDPGASEKRGLINLPMYDEDTGESCIPAWHDAPIFFVFIGFLAVLANLAMFVSQILPFILIGGKMQILDGLLRAFMLVFSIIFLLCEIEIPFMTTNIVSMQDWVTRGIMYVFLGLVTAQEQKGIQVVTVVKGKKKFHMSAQATLLFIKISAWAMVAIGVVYFLMGICRLKKVRDSKKTPEESKTQEEVA
eukprot:CAMPEP_0183308508 /NCGR_PEP_ID=MMETSP0160_2-20130417/22296_1 /TAXON_ID=2839 ORGANISM="Odontella Sinensis, Strain Grunow 1884" /NCGR_SAMPLE_ID=MMETSP0160_2 /ASSEMBLY_ACC=CAM_ASM_000250 /LENGTH=205 /DNA_ID=CAMNT_0025472361 /DNA_START=91 /DNA_END=708 /DNA_ORIENTATION=-